MYHDIADAIKIKDRVMQTKPVKKHKLPCKRI